MKPKSAKAKLVKRIKARFPTKAELDAVHVIALEIARRTVEDTVIDFRDRRIVFINAGNGFVCREKNGDASEMIRLSTADGLRIGIAAYLKARAKP